MNSREYEKSLAVLAAYRMSQSDSLEEMTAILCVLRNQVRYQRLTYSDVIEQLYLQLEEEEQPLKSYPNIADPILIEPSSGLLSVIDRVYRYDMSAMPDITSDKNNPTGAMWFARTTSLDPARRFYKTIIEHPEVHPLIGQWGAQSFFA